VTGSIQFVKFTVFAPILLVKDTHRMTDHKKPQPISDYRAEHHARRSFTPLNRRKDGALFREIGERIRAGYYDSSQVLRTIAERITGTM